MVFASWPKPNVPPLECVSRTLRGRGPVWQGLPFGRPRRLCSRRCQLDAARRPGPRRDMRWVQRQCPGSVRVKRRRPRLAPRRGRRRRHTDACLQECERSGFSSLLPVAQCLQSHTQLSRRDSALHENHRTVFYIFLPSAELSGTNSGTHCTTLCVILVQK